MSCLEWNRKSGSSEGGKSRLHIIGVGEAVLEASRSCVTGVQSVPALSVLLGMWSEAFWVRMCTDVYLS